MFEFQMKYKNLKNEDDNINLIKKSSNGIISKSNNTRRNKIIFGIIFLILFSICVLYFGIKFLNHRRNFFNKKLISCYTDKINGSMDIYESTYYLFFF